jgi:hypothetical protein
MRIKKNIAAALLALTMAYCAAAQAAAPPDNIVRMNPFVSTAKTGFSVNGDAATARTVYGKVQSYGNIGAAPVGGWMAAAATDIKFLKPGAAPDGFDSVDLPHSWGKDPIRLLRTDFIMPDNVNGFALAGNVSLAFSGSGTMDVYVNGKKVKSLTGGGDLDITGRIKPGETVTLGVKITEMTGRGKLQSVTLRSADLDALRAPVDEILTKIETARLLFEQLPRKPKGLLDAVISAGREIDALKGVTDIARVRAALDAIKTLLAPIDELTARYPVFNAGPALQNVKQDAITVTWETRAPAPSAVYYGKGALDSVMSDPAPVTFHKVAITGLDTETEYKYLAVSAEMAAPESTFKTAIRRDTPFSFMVFADDQSNPQIFEPLVDRMIPLKPDLVISVGDEVGTGSDYAAWAREFFYPLRRLISHTPFFVAIGNHEYGGYACGKPVPWFDNYMALPANHGYYYAVTYGNSRFIMFNQQEDPGCPGIVPGTEQYEWLLRELESPEYKAADFHFMFMHKPPYSNCWAGGYYDGEASVRANVVPLIEKYGVDIVFSGHTHDYERGQWPRPGGPYYIITGGAGGHLDDTVYKEWPQMQLHAFVHHFSHVTINGNKLSFEAVDADGNIIDTFEIVKE